MGTWTADELDAFTGADDLHIAPLREDCTTYGTPTWIWSVVVDGSLYVRPYNGQRSRWYRSAMSHTAGRIRVAGGEHAVGFESADPAVLDAVDAAYRRKYAGSQYLEHMVSSGPRESTVRLRPGLAKRRQAPGRKQHRRIRRSVSPPAKGGPFRSIAAEGATLLGIIHTRSWTEPVLPRYRRGQVVARGLIHRSRSTDSDPEGARGEVLVEVT